MFKLSKASKDALTGVNPELIAVVVLALSRSPIDFKVTEGVRTIERQRQLYRDGRSQTLNSRHLVGEAVDVAAIVDGQVNWKFSNYLPIAEAMKDAARTLGVPDLVWGGDWHNFKDGPHFQIGR